MPENENQNTDVAADRSWHNPIRILGVDPGLRVTGYAVLEFGNSTMIQGGVAAPGKQTSASLPFNFLNPKIKIIEAGVIRVASDQPMEKRLAQIKSSIDEVLNDLRPTEMALEKLYAHYERTQPAILMGHARGVLMLAAAHHSIEVTGYAATAVKKTVSGHGRAPKTQMQAAVCRHLGLKKPPEPHDVADALAIALCHYFLAHSPMKAQLLVGLESMKNAKANTIPRAARKKMDSAQNDRPEDFR